MDWKKYDLSSYLIEAESAKSTLVNLSDGYKTWIANKLITKSYKNIRFLSNDKFEYKISKTKKVNGRYETFNEQIVNVAELLKRIREVEDTLVHIYIAKRYIKRKTEKAYLIGFLDNEYKFNSFWIPKRLTTKIGSDIEIGLLNNFEIKVSFLDEESEKYTDKIYTPAILKEYMIDQENQLEKTMYSTPSYLPAPENVEIDSDLKDDYEQYSDTGVLQTKTLLFEHQKKAVAKMLPTRTGALFMDMGTGKTRVLLEIIKIRQKKISKVIWITPVSLKYNLLLDIKKHTNLDDDDICVFDGKNNEINTPNKSFYIVGIESIGMSDRVYLTLNKIIDNDTFIVMDESSFIKGYSKQTKRIILLSKNTRYRMILTGTPISQGIVDLYSQFNFLSPKIFGYLSFYSFASKHLKYSRKYPGMIVESYNEKFLAEKMKPYVYQVTKEECLELPQKHHIDKYFDMTEDQRDIYEKAKNEILFGSDGDNEEYYSRYDIGSVIFELFNALQQIVSGYWNHEDEIIETDNPRLDLLDCIVKEIDKDEKVIIWAKFIYDIKNIKKMLNKKYKKDSYVLYTGKQNESEKKDALNEFINGDARFFIATQGTGAYGLNLTNCSTAIFYNNNFKYSQRIQAEDRIHRIGQNKQVNYINISCANSIDIKIDNSLYCKSNVVKDFKYEIEQVKDKKLKIALLNAIIDGDLKKAEEIKEKDRKSRSSSTKRMEKMRRKRGIIPREEYIKNSISFKKPWEELKISRATWYRKQKNQKKDNEI